MTQLPSEEPSPAHQREEGGVLGARQQHLDGQGFVEAVSPWPSSVDTRFAPRQTTETLPSTTRSSVSAERSIGSRVSWGSSRTANERTSLVSNPGSRGSRDRALGSGAANKDDGRSSAPEHQTPVVATEAVAESCSVRADQATCKLVEPVQRESADRVRAERMAARATGSRAGRRCGSSPADRSGRHAASPSSSVAMRCATAASRRRSHSSVRSLASTRTGSRCGRW